MIVVVESPCAPQPAAVEKLIKMPSSEAAQIYGKSCVGDAGLTDWQVFRDNAKSSEQIHKYAQRVIRARNTYYARAAMLDCLLRGEAPFLSHLLYTQVLDDDVAEERKLGMDAGIELSHRLLLDEDVAHVFYDELGISAGMRSAAESMSPDADVRRIDFGRRKLGDAARAWYLARVPAAIAWLV